MARFTRYCVIICHLALTLLPPGFDTANTSPVPSQTGQFGVAVAVLVFGGVFSALPMKYLNKVALASLTWLVLGALTIIIALPAIAPKGPTPGMNYREARC